MFERAEMTEEHLVLLDFGFFLLGSQFVALEVLGLVDHLPLRSLLVLLVFHLSYLNSFALAVRVVQGFEELFSVAETVAVLGILGLGSESLLHLHLHVLEGVAHHREQPSQSHGYGFLGFHGLVAEHAAAHEAHALPVLVLVLLESSLSHLFLLPVVLLHCVEHIHSGAHSALQHLIEHSEGIARQS